MMKNSFFEQTVYELKTNSKKKMIKIILRIGLIKQIKITI